MRELQLRHLAEALESEKLLSVNLYSKLLVDASLGDEGKRIFPSRSGLLTENSIIFVESPLCKPASRSIAG